MEAAVLGCIGATILRPVSFMENFTGGYALQGGALATALAPEVPQQIMAVDDVGFVTSLVLSRPEKWIGRAVALAARELTPVQITVAIESTLGHRLPYARIPIEAIRALSEDFAFANEWLNERRGLTWQEGESPRLRASGAFRLRRQRVAPAGTQGSMTRRSMRPSRSVNW
ncbi:NmrA family NAD(P)-binding protein [Streptomyces sioyaensis]|uniref:NmrA family NAD(P)-binding protein n=1 Tax=Streptomyces sioyaensis TaxID=67364 RepID=UPI00378B84E4